MVLSRSSIPTDFLPNDSASFQESFDTFNNTLGFCQLLSILSLFASCALEFNCLVPIHFNGLFGKLDFLSLHKVLLCLLCSDASFIWYYYVWNSQLSSGVCLQTFVSWMFSVMLGWSFSGQSEQDFTVLSCLFVCFVCTFGISRWLTFLVQAVGCKRQKGNPGNSQASCHSCPTVLSWSTLFPLILEYSYFWFIYNFQGF